MAAVTMFILSVPDVCLKRTCILLYVSCRDGRCLVLDIVARQRSLLLITPLPAIRTSGRKKSMIGL